MVKKIKFLSPQSTYRELKDLLESTSLKTIPLVDSKGLFGEQKQLCVKKIINMYLKSHCSKNKFAIVLYCIVNFIVPLGGSLFCSMVNSHWQNIKSPFAQYLEKQM